MAVLNSVRLSASRAWRFKGVRGSGGEVSRGEREPSPVVVTVELGQEGSVETG